MVRRSGSNPTAQTLDLGLARLLRECLRHNPPLPLELEHAIELTETLVMPLATTFSGPHTLVLQGSGAAMLEQYLLSGSQGMSLDAVEDVFNRLAARSLGRPASQDTLPADARWCAALVVLREFMHHLRFEHVLLQGDAPWTES